MGKPAEGEPEQEKTHDRRRYQPQIHLHGAKLPGKGQGRGEQGNVNHHVDEEQSAVGNFKVKLKRNQMWINRLRFLFPRFNASAKWQLSRTKQ